MRDAEPRSHDPEGRGSREGCSWSSRAALRAAHCSTGRDGLSHPPRTQHDRRPVRVPPFFLLNRRYRRAPNSGPRILSCLICTPHSFCRVFENLNLHPPLIQNSSEIAHRNFNLHPRQVSYTNFCGSFSPSSSLEIETRSPL